jgi:F-type H+-transporting ATPase subunit epsilon
MLTFELVSPERKVFSAPVAMVVAPGSEGAFGIMEGHIPFLSTLQVGIIDIYANDPANITQRLLVSGGVAEVNGSIFTILAEDAVALNEANSETLRIELDQNKVLLDQTSDPITRSKIAKAIDVLEKKITLLDGLKSH